GADPIVAHRLGNDVDAGEGRAGHVDLLHGGVIDAAHDGYGGEPLFEAAGEIELELVEGGDAGQVGGLGAHRFGRIGRDVLPHQEEILAGRGLVHDLLQGGAQGIGGHLQDD